MINELSILDDIFNTAYAAFPELSCPSYSPDVDVLESKNAYTISMNLPGMTEKDVDISLKEGILTISSVPKTEEKASTSEGSENAEESKEDAPVYLIRERHTISFARSFKLPRDTDHNSISANFKNGVLEVSIPRKEAELPKRIAISVA